MLNTPYVKVQQEKAGKVSVTAVIEEGTAAMQKAVEHAMDQLESSGKA